MKNKLYNVKVIYNDCYYQEECEINHKIHAKNRRIAIFKLGLMIDFGKYITDVKTVKISKALYGKAKKGANDEFMF